MHMSKICSSLLSHFQTGRMLRASLNGFSTCFRRVINSINSASNALINSEGYFNGRVLYSREERLDHYGPPTQLHHHPAHDTKIDVDRTGLNHSGTSAYYTHRLQLMDKLQVTDYGNV